MNEIMGTTLKGRLKEKAKKYIYTKNKEGGGKSTGMNKMEWNLGWVGIFCSCEYGQCIGQILIRIPGPDLHIDSDLTVFGSGTTTLIHNPAKCSGFN